MRVIVYKYTNLTNGKVYIGITTQKLSARHREHLNKINDGTYFHNALLKYGEEGVNLEILDYAKTVESLKAKEKYWIKKLNSFAYQNNSNGYNCTLGGDGAMGLCGELNPQYGISPQERMDDTTFKMWKKNLKKSASKGKDHRCYGKHPSEIFGNKGFERACYKAKKRFIENNPSEYRNYYGDKNPNARKVVQLSKSGEYMAIFNTIKEASSVTGASQGHIGSCCTGGRKTTGGYRWEYYENYINTVLKKEGDGIENQRRRTKAC
jgi:group I intron endonuclease